ncbi:nucleoside deaminase [Aeromonas rivipollensis]|uniref:nucleoside deaminase n=1 Tax=Aeromonas rivipollensis TaxID=948519 RepID=UPI00259D8303|nr:nucleoside deaminase [Aeromonas rivipollensis]MDM5086701.1 nucleoside deaminase [Aeromonas rivipollensis]MDM5098685.1 nucleoside deaminase [Aeromonas rivipollensis]MDM5107043.1 nucleoside deaminase [Aeromonas rivipollensis]
MSQPPQSGARPVNALSAVSAPSHQAWLEQTLQLALTHRQQGGRPFAALLVRDNQLVASAVNRMLEAGDPSRHAELEALREGSRKGPLAGAIVYASGHPCPMCLCALVMNGISAVYYAFDNEDAAPFGFDSSASYDRLRLPLNPPPLPLVKLPSPIPAAVLYGPQSHG